MKYKKVLVLCCNMWNVYLLSFKCLIGQHRNIALSHAAAIFLDSEIYRLVKTGTYLRSIYRETLIIDMNMNAFLTYKSVKI